MRDIVIHPVLNGFSVQVGCQTVVFENLADMAGAIMAYYTDPEGVERQYRELPHAKHLLGPSPIYANPQDIRVTGGPDVTSMLIRTEL